MITKDCEYCRESFVTYEYRGKTQRFCDNICREKFTKKFLTNIKKCKFCQKEFKSLKCKNKLYCSKECRINSTKNKEERLCKHCKKEFIVRPAKLKIFCSRECFSLSQRLEKIKKECLTCKKIIYVFPYEKSVNNYCSKKCVDESKKVKLEGKICKHCKKVFYRKPFWIKIRIYCSSKCQSDASKGREVSDEFRKICRINKIRYIQEQKFKGLPMGPTIGKNETEILNKIESEKGIKLKRQFPVSGFFIDGYDIKNKVAYEVDEYYHKSEKIRIKDKYREECIKNKLGCTFIRIKDEWRKWMKNKC